MDPRPILLVKDPLCTRDGLKLELHEHTAGVLADEGYFVLRCPPEAMGSMRILAPCPFTVADVTALREFAQASRAAGLATVDERAEVDRRKGVLESIAERMEHLLPELARGILDDLTLHVREVTKVSGWPKHVLCASDVMADVRQAMNDETRYPGNGTELINIDGVPLEEDPYLPRGHFIARMD